MAKVTVTDESSLRRALAQAGRLNDLKSESRRLRVQIKELDSVQLGAKDPRFGQVENRAALQAAGAEIDVKLAVANSQLKTIESQIAVLEPGIAEAARKLGEIDRTADAALREKIAGTVRAAVDSCKVWADVLAERHKLADVKLRLGEASREVHELRRGVPAEGNSPEDLALALLDGADLSQKVPDGIEISRRVKSLDKSIETFTRAQRIQESALPRPNGC